jgi:hypothetical protein
VNDGSSLKNYGLTELRACLFFEQRRFRNFGWDPGPDEMCYVRALLNAIRGRAAM